MGLQPNQTGPLNIAGGLEGEGNDLGFHHTSLGTETHHRQTDGQTDRQEPGRRTHLTLGSLPFAPTRKESQNTGYADNPALPPATHSSVCGDLPPATGGPQGRLPMALPSLWFAPGQLHTLFLPSASSSVTRRRLLSPTRTFSLLLSAFWPPCPRAPWGSSISGTFLLPRAPARPCLPSRGAHTAAPLSLRSGAERCRLIRGGVVYGG